MNVTFEKAMCCVFRPHLGPAPENILFQPKKLNSPQIDENKTTEVLLSGNFKI